MSKKYFDDRDCMNDINDVNDVLDEIALSDDLGNDDKAALCDICGVDAISVINGIISIKDVCDKLKEMCANDDLDKYDKAMIIEMY